MIRTLLRLVEGQPRHLLPGYVALVVLSVALRAASCVLLVPIVARLFAEDPAAAWGWVAGFSVVALAGLAVDRKLAVLSYSIGFDLLGGVQRQLVDHLGTLPLGWFHTEHRLAAQQAVATTGPPLVGLVVYQLTPVVSAVLLPVAIGLGLVTVAPPLGLVALVAAPALLGAQWASARFLRGAEERHAQSIQELDDRVVEFARIQPALRSAGRADPEVSRAGEALRSHRHAFGRVLWRAVPGELAFSLASQLALVVLAVVAVRLWRDGSVGAAEAVALLVVAARFLEPFGDLAELAPAVESSRNLLRRIRDLLDTPSLTAPTTRPAGWAPPALGGPPALELRDVAFAPGARRLLDGLSFTAPAGAVTAIVGPSGSGKTTILRLVARFHDVDAGAVLLDGHDVRSLPIDDLLGQISIVFQDVYLFDGTIRENLAAGDAAEQARVARLAGVEEMLARLPAGWDTRVGEGGTALSGGERQRVSIARALLKPAPLLLLDEATSGLDAENETAVVQAIAAERGRRTIVVVAHRLETIRDADQVVFLDEGRIVESGPPDDLVAAGGRFARWWHQRATSRLWTLNRTP